MDARTKNETINFFKLIVEKYIEDADELDKIVSYLTTNLNNLPKEKQEYIHNKVTLLFAIDQNIFSPGSALSDQYNEIAIKAKKQIYKLQGTVILLYIKNHTPSQKCRNVISALLSTFTNKTETMASILSEKLSEDIKPAPSAGSPLAPPTPLKIVDGTGGKTIIGKKELEDPKIIRVDDKSPFVTGPTIIRKPPKDKGNHSLLDPKSYRKKVESDRTSIDSLDLAVLTPKSKKK